MAENETGSYETITLPIKVVRLLLQTIIVAAIGGGSGFIGFRIAGDTAPGSVAALRSEIERNPSMRADPFTGTQGKELERRIEVLERRQERIKEIDEAHGAAIAGIKNDLAHIQRDHDVLIRHLYGKSNP